MSLNRFRPTSQLCEVIRDAIVGKENISFVLLLKAEHLQLIRPRTTRPASYIET